MRRRRRIIRRRRDGMEEANSDCTLVSDPRFVVFIHLSEKSMD